MSQLSLNQTIESRITNPESVQRKGIIKNSENNPKKRPDSALAPKIGNEDCTSIVGDVARTRKLGVVPNYLKKQTKSTVESELVTKHKKFKIAKRELVEKQTNLMKEFEQLRTLKEKFKQFGGRDFKLETLELIEFTGCGNASGFGDGEQNTGRSESVSLTPGYDDNLGNMLDFQRDIQRTRGRVKDGLVKLIELNAEAFRHIQVLGNEKLQDKIQGIFLKIEEYVSSVNSEQDTSMQFLLEKLQKKRNHLPEEVQPSKDLAVRDDEDVAALRKVIQNLEVKTKMLQSEIDVKNREVEYLKNKEVAYSKSRDNVYDTSVDSNRLELLQSEILSQKALINDYQMKQNEQYKLKEILEEKVRRLEETVGRQNQQMDDTVLQFENDLLEERKKNEELEKRLVETNDENLKIIKKNDSNFELVANQLSSANEDIKELNFKIGKRDKQIQNLKQMLNVESNKLKEYDQLLVKYEELWQLDQLKTNELNQLKEKLIARNDTVNSQVLVISDLKKKLMARSTDDGGAECGKNNTTGPLLDEHMAKFLDHERIIKKLENNKIRSNLLRDQLLERISMLEKENVDMKAQIRKFHEDFTINRFMYDEQRRKKRLTEILVKQYQK